MNKKVFASVYKPGLGDYAGSHVLTGLREKYPATAQGMKDALNFVAKWQSKAKKQKQNEFAVIVVGNTDSETHCISPSEQHDEASNRLFFYAN